MAPYATSGQNTLTLNPVTPTILYPGDDDYAFGLAPITPGLTQDPQDFNVQFEAVVVGERSIAYVLAPRPAGGGPPSLMVEVRANANPGAMEIDIQDAGTDADGAYLTPTGSTAYKITAWTAIAGGVFVGWTELSPEAGRFITLKVIANPNAVSITGKLQYI